MFSVSLLLYKITKQSFQLHADLVSGHSDLNSLLVLVNRIIIIQVHLFLCPGKVLSQHVKSQRALVSHHAVRVRKSGPHVAGVRQA